MQLSKYGEIFITTEESVRRIVYNNGDGVPTGGWGHTGHYLDGTPLKVGDERGLEEWLDMFREDIHHVEDALNTKMIQTRIGLAQFRFDALCSLLFNCGVGLLNPSHDLGKAFETMDYMKIGESIREYSMATINGIRKNWLQARRDAEYWMYTGLKQVKTPSGTYQTAAVISG